MSKLNINQDPERRTRSPIKNPMVWIPMAILCTMLWGSAFPSVKMGYELFQVDTKDVFSLLVFAGVRFTLAGLLTLLLSVPITKQLPRIDGSEFKGVFLLGIVQTTIQYAFFYVSLSNTSGVNGSILSSTTGFISVGLAAVYYKNDRMTFGKALGCIMGFSGVVLLNLGKGEISSDFALNGELLMLMAAAFSAVGALISKELTSKTDSFVVTGYQLLIGGIILTAIGYLGGGHISPSQPSSLVLLMYLALISCLAFGLWTTLLKHHPLSKISIFHALIPAFGSALSVLFLGETLRLASVASLLLIIGGIVVLNNWDEKAAKLKLRDQ